MPLYTYLARDKQGNIKKGEINLESEQKLGKWLYDQGFFLSKFEVKGEEKRGSSFNKILLNLGYISLMDKVLFTNYLEVMLKAGLSLVRALAILSEQTKKKKMKRIVSDLQYEVERGKPFYEALSRYPHVFSDLYVNVVKTGEVSGKLDQVLHELAVQLKKDRDLVKKVTGAMFYPVIVIVAMVGIGFVMMTFVLPKLIKIFEEFNTKLPLPTRILIAVSKFLGEYWLPILGVLLFLGFFLFRFMKSKAGRNVFHLFYLKIPLVARTVKKVNLARFVRNLASLLAAGIPILQALDIIASALGNVYYQRTIRESIKEVQKGIPLSRALSSSPHLFPPVVTQVMQVGEETASFEDILLRLADFYEQDVEQTMKNISTIIEPILMLILGVVVGAMAISIILPIYTLTSTL